MPQVRRVTSPVMVPGTNARSAWRGPVDTGATSPSRWPRSTSREICSPICYGCSQSCGRRRSRRQLKAFGCHAFEPNLWERCAVMSENPAIFGGVQGVGSSRPRGQITEKAPTWRKRQIEACLDPNRRLPGECRFKGSICF